jgi:general secretion pathway protein I
MRNQRGFTLVEIVVAFVLLSAVLMTGFEIFSQGLRRAGDLDDEARAIVIAQSKLATAGMEEFKEGAWQGQSEDGRFRWTLVIQRTDEGSAGPGQPINNAYQLFRVDVRVEWTSVDSRARTLELATLALGSRS